VIPIIRSTCAGEFYFEEEGCWITELSNHADDPAVSVARARVEAGVTTGWHSLKNTTERYIILSGEGMVEFDGLPASNISPGATVTIPAGCRQRITNTGKLDLVFLAVCTPRFSPANYCCEQ
jgi:mannose-6-phosphate isomerase-like protein (cupin superfamily)